VGHEGNCFLTSAYATGCRLVEANSTSRAAVYNEITPNSIGVRETVTSREKKYFQLYRIKQFKLTIRDQKGKLYIFKELINWLTVTRHSSTSNPKIKEINRG
jgi:hypothetical protein